MRIRYTNDIDIQMSYPTNAETLNVKIPPLLLIVFIENAFKHGVSYNKKSFIHVSINCVDGCVVSVIENSKHAISNRDHIGIGLDNVNKRLELIYDNQHELVIDDGDPNIYRVKLIIPALNG